jgi:hypothetical protein
MVFTLFAIYGSSKACRPTSRFRCGFDASVYEFSIKMPRGRFCLHGSFGRLTLVVVTDINRFWKYPMENNDATLDAERVVYGSVHGPGVR